ncbi:MAG: beta strand repeat-containing protein, partial [Shewanella sp.]
QIGNSFGNTVSITQSGNQNYAGAKTELGDGNTITITQAGNRNRVTNNPNAVNYYGTGFGAGTFGQDNDVVISQTGSDNLAYADSADNNSSVDIEQDGEFNNAAAESWAGTANDIDISQTGNNHTADVYVSGGSTNSVTVTQTDAFNTASVTSLGSNNTVVVNQGSGSI